MMFTDVICVGNEVQQQGYYFAFANICLFLLQLGEDNEIWLALFWFLFNQGISVFITQKDSPMDLKR